MWGGGVGIYVDVCLPFILLNNLLLYIIEHLDPYLDSHYGASEKPGVGSSGIATAATEVFVKDEAVSAIFTIALKCINLSSQHYNY
jgi:hypothetical protein